MGKPILTKGQKFVDDEGRTLIVTRDCFGGEIVTNKQFVYEDTGEHPQVNTEICRSILEYVWPSQ